MCETKIYKEKIKEEIANNLVENVSKIFYTSDCQ